MSYVKQKRKLEGRRTFLLKSFRGLKNEEGSIPQSSILLRMRTLHSKSPSAAKDRTFMLHSGNYLDLPSIKEERSITKKGRLKKVEVGFRKAVIYVSNERRRELLITSWMKRCHVLPETSFRVQFKKRNMSVKVFIDRFHLFN
ncbi:hypothetical protein CDAR_397381 [Caerostris darwini]|uniref:Ribosomal protein S10 n=1 Tax=Caerostris darwini TaxID=1538125 RepID=A0AAV4T2X9_9ARAC|nr:hypothetical protein CDAR_397381 [Caerostris darwini]